MNRPINFSERTNWDLSTNQVVAALEENRAKGQTLLDLTESNPTRCGFKYFHHNLLKPLSAIANLRYEPNPRGSTETRKAISAYYAEFGYVVDPERIFLTSSTSEAYSYLFRLLLNPKERVLFPRPSYPLFQFLVDINDVIMDNYQLVFNEGWEIDFKDLRLSVGMDTKAIVLVNPNNPTGSYVKQKELTVLNEICSREGLALISDEVFLDYPLNPKERPLSFVGNTEALTFTLSGVSKVVGLPQMKLSWIVVSGPATDVKAACERLEVISDTFLSVSTPTQLSSVTWLKKRGPIQHEIQKRIKENEALLIHYLSNRDDIRYLPSEGGWYGVLKLSDATRADSIAIDCLTHDGVFIHPGYFFDFNDDTFLIVSFLTKSLVFKKGISKLLKRLEVPSS